MKKKILFNFLRIISLILVLGTYAISGTPRKVDGDLEPKLSAPPIINIISPSTNQLFGIIAPDFLVDINDPGVNETWYTIDGGNTNITFMGNGTIDQTEWNFRPNGTVTITFYANNTGGEESSNSVTIRRDFNAPSIIIYSPIYNTLFGSTAPGYNVSITDPSGVNLTWYAMVPGPNYTFSGSTGTINETLWDAKGNGTVTIRFYAKDEAGNMNTAEVTVRKDINAPSITINSPIPNQSFGIISPNFDVSITDGNLQWSWYELNNGTDWSSNYTFGGSIGTINQNAWDFFANGTVIIRFYANDTAGNLNWTEVTVRKDINVPSITINSPTANELFGSTAPDFDVTITDPSGVNTTWYTIDAGANYTFSGSTGTFDETAWDGEGNGTVTIRFYANDTAGNLNWAEVTVRKDIDSPSITINSPTSNELFGSTAPDFDVTITDPSGVNTTWYTIDAGTTNFTFSGSTGTIDEAAWDGEGNGTVTIRFYANDTAGNLNWTEVTVRQDINVPSITINSPFANELFGVTTPGFNVTITDPSGVNTTWYTIDTGTTNFTFSGSISTIDEAAWDGEGNGTVTIRFYANDTDGNTNWAEVTIRKDIILPSITINSPSFNELFGLTPPGFDLTFSDPSGVDSVWCVVEGPVNSSFAVIGTSGTIYKSIWDILGNGTVKIWFFINDTVKNTNGAEVTVRKDIIGPIINIYSPPANESYGSSSPGFSVEITDPSGISTTWYTLDGGITNYTFSGSSGNIDGTAWNNVVDEDVTIRFYAYDEAENLNWADVNVHKAINGGSYQPSGNDDNLLFWILFPIIIGAVSFSVAIPIKKHSSKKKRKVKDLFPSGKQKDWDFFGVPQDRELIFISYATKDSELFQIPRITEILKHYPEIDDVLYWESDMLDDIYGYMDENLKRCKLVLLFCTKNSSYSEAVKMEWRSALKLGKKILPVFIDEEYIPTLLTTKLGIQFNKEDPYGSIEKIYQLILKKLEIQSIREYCKYLVPSVITEEDFEGFVSTTNNKEYFVDSELKTNVLADKIIPILRANNFYILGYKPMLKKKKKGQQPIEFDIKVIKCFAEDKNDDQKIGLSITIQKETILSSKIMVKVYGKRDWVLTEISSDLSNKLLDLKSINLLLKEYSEQLEKALEKIPEGDTFFRKTFGPDYKKLKRLISQYLNHEIEKTFLISEGIQIIGKEFLTKTIKALIFGE